MPFKKLITTLPRSQGPRTHLIQDERSARRAAAAAATTAAMAAT